MAVRQDQVQIRIDLITDESKQYAKTIKDTKTLTKDLFRAEKAGKDVSGAIRAIAREATKVEKIDLSRLTPAQLVQRSRQLATVLRRIPQSAPEYRQLAAEVQRVNSQLSETRRQTRGVAASANRLRSSAGFISTALGTLTGFTLAGVFQQLGNLGRRVVQVGSEFEKLEAVLVNTLGSNSAAEAALDLIQEYAARTPFQVEEITEAYIRLTNRGLQPTRAELTLLGDLAASQGKSFIQLSEAVLDATQGEFERLKEFGIRASRANGEVTLSFKNQQVVVEDTADAIQDAILAFGEVEGVLGSTEAIANTSAGALSNLQDAWSRLLASFLNSEGLVRVVGLLTDLLNRIRLLTGGQDARIDDLVNTFYEQADAAEASNRHLGGLVDTIERLQTKSSLSKDEQKELATAMTEVQKVTPSAVTELDEYGRAMGLNTDKVREFIKAEKQRIELLNESTVQALNQQLDNLLDQREVLEKQLGGTSGGLIPVRLTEKQLAKVQQDFISLNQLIEETRGKLAELEGGGPDPQTDSPPGTTDTSRPPGSSRRRGPTQEQVLRAELKGVEVLINQRKVLLERDRLNREISRKEYAERVLKLDEELYREQLALYEQFGKEQSTEALQLGNELIRISQLRNRDAGAVSALSGRRTEGSVEETGADLGFSEAVEEQQLARLNNAFERALVSEGEYALEKLRIRESALEREIALLRQGNEQEVMLARKKAEELKDVQNDIVVQSNENKQRQIQVQQELEQSAISAVGEFAQLGADLLASDDEAREKYAKTMRAFNAAQVTAASVVEIQRIWSNAATFGPLQSVVAGLQTAAAVARTVRAIAKINSVKYAQGGLAQVGVFGGKPHSQGGTKGYFEDGTAIEVERDELFAVVNKRSTGMLRRLSQLNQAGGGVAYARGGLLKMQSGALTDLNTTPGSISTPAPATAQADIMPVLAELRAFSSAVRDFPREVKANIVYSEYESTADEISSIQSEANL